jgi:hypothetical protein
MRLWQLFQKTVPGQDWPDQDAKGFFLLLETSSLRENGDSSIELSIDYEKTVASSGLATAASVC